MGKLTAKQKIFVASYLKTFNATLAAKMAGYSERTAYAIGWENLKKPEIAAEIEERLTQAAMSADETLAHLATIARNGETAHQLKALELLAKHLGLFEANNRLRVDSMSINLSDLSDSQLERLANGEDIKNVLRDD